MRLKKIFSKSDKREKKMAKVKFSVGVDYITEYVENH